LVYNEAMRSFFSPFRRLAIYCLVTGLLCLGLSPLTVKAAALTSVSDTPSNGTANHINTTHSLAFTINTSDTLKRITFRFSTTLGGTTKPAHLDLSSATLGSISGLGGGWSLSTSNAANGEIYIANLSGESVSASTSITVPLLGITNSAIDDCQPGNDTLYDTCPVRITTYSDEGGTSVDSGDTSYSVEEDLSMNFTIETVPANTSINGITTTLNSSTNSLPLSHLRPNQVQYIAQKLTITSNAPHGYVVTAYLSSSIRGSSDAATISPFSATDVSWNTPQLWSSPPGSTPGDDTGWIGANTSDTRVAGWDSASAKFGPISTTPHVVAFSDGPDREGSVVYVTYAIEVGPAQPADYYRGKIMYNVQTIY